MEKITIFNNVTFYINDNLIFTENDDKTPVITDSNATFKIQFYHKKLNPILLSIVNKNAMRDSLAADFKKENSTFTRGVNYLINVAGKNRLGLKYSFEVDGVTKNGDTIIITKGGNYYVISFSCDKETYEATYETFLDVLESIKL